MNNKTCGECRFYHPILKHEGVCTATSDLRKTCDFTTVCAIGGVYLKPKPTNGDRIRQMSNEEIREHLHLLMSCPDCPVVDKCKTMADCKKNLLAWLNAPAESEGRNK